MVNFFEKFEVMKANCLQCTIQNQARYATLRLLKEYEKINIHQFADGIPW